MLFWIVGCAKQPETFDELVNKAAQLPGVRSSQHSALREEFRQVEASQTLPVQLNTDATLVHQNAAAALDDALGDMDEVASINEHTAAFLGALPAADHDYVVVESGALSAKWLRQTQDVAKASQLPECDFALKFERGYFNSIDFVYQAGAASRLLLVDALYNLEDKPAVALARFAAAWKWTNWLAETGHLEARVQAALVRADALNAAEVIANRPAITTEQLAALQRVLQESLDASPSIEATLVRERAMAIAAYEAIRLGMTDMLFTIDERAHLREQGVYQQLRAADPDQVDADQAAYLAYMREIISVANQPFFARSKHLIESDRLLRAGEHGNSFPWFANHLFVAHNSMTRAQAEIARDRSRIEGWLHLLAAATNQPAKAGAINPLNGERYVPHSSGNQWFLALGDRRSVNPRLTLPAP